MTITRVREGQGQGTESVKRTPKERMLDKPRGGTAVCFAVVQETDFKALDTLMVGFEQGKDRKGFRRRRETREPEYSTSRVLVIGSLLLVEVYLDIQA